jgi:hypothetical protein
MKINEIINEAGAPELLQQELDQLVELIKKGGYAMTPEDMYVFQQAKENKVFHSDEIDLKTHNRKLGAEINPELSRLREVLKQSGDISHLVDYDLTANYKELLTQQVRTDPEIKRIYRYVRTLLLKNSCNGTWSQGACYLDNHKWILDMGKEKRNAQQHAYQEKYRQDPEWVKKSNAQSLAYYEKYKQDPEWVEKHNTQARAYQEKMRQDPEYVKKRQDPEWVEKEKARQHAYYNKNKST